jgi:putative salt-induced outer membrane protein YdiY
MPAIEGEGTYIMAHANCRRSLRIASLACFSFSAAVADQVMLKNGDRVTGTILKKDDKNITIKTLHFGIVTTEWDQVARISADQPINVVLQDGRELQGTLSTEAGQLELKAQNGTIRVPPSQIAVLRGADEQRAHERLQHPGWLELWSGTVSLGFAGAIGNAMTSTLTSSLDAERATRTDRTSIYFKTINATALVDGQSKETAQAVRAGIAYNHNIGSKVFLNGFNDWEHDQFQNLDLRFVIGGGAGYHLIKSEMSMLDLLAGFDYNHSAFSTPATRNSAEFFWGDEYKFKLNSVTQLIQSYRMFNNLNDTATYRINFDVGLATKLRSWLNWNVSLSNRYLSTPAPGRKTNDLLYSTGLGIAFAR